MYIIVNELEKDVLREIISIGLARAADSFSTFAKGGVLLDVPDIKIVEPRVLPDVIDEYEAIYYVVKATISGDINGKTFLLFTAENIHKIADVCLSEVELLSPHVQEHKNNMLLKISEIITAALAGQLGKILNLELTSGHATALFPDEESSIHHILEEVPNYQPFVITIKTQFRKLIKSVDLPMLVVFDSLSVSHLLRTIRANNLYDYKLLQKSSTQTT